MSYLRVRRSRVLRFRSNMFSLYYYYRHAVRLSAKLADRQPSTWCSSAGGAAQDLALFEQATLQALLSPSRSHMPACRVHAAPGFGLSVKLLKSTSVDKGDAKTRRTSLAYDGGHPRHN